MTGLLRHIVLIYSPRLDAYHVHDERVEHIATVAYVNGAWCQLRADGPDGGILAHPGDELTRDALICRLLRERGWNAASLETHNGNDTRARVVPAPPGSGRAAEDRLPDAGGQGHRAARAPLRRAGGSPQGAESGAPVPRPGAPASRSSARGLSRRPLLRKTPQQVQA